MDNSNPERTQRFAVFFLIAATLAWLLYQNNEAQKQRLAMEQQQQQKQLAGQAAATAEAAQANPAKPAEIANTPTPAAPTAAIPESTSVEDVVVKTREYQAVFTSKGAALKRFTFNNYLRSASGDQQALTLVDEIQPDATSLRIDRIFEAEQGSQTSLTGDKAQSLPLAGRNYTIVKRPPLDASAGEKQELVFAAELNNWRITKTFIFDPAIPFGFDLSVKIENLGQKPRRMLWRMAAIAGAIPDDVSQQFGIMECLVATCDKGNPQNDGLSVKRHIVTDLKKNPASEKGQNLAWLALKNRFFISLLMVNNPALSAEVTASALDYSKNYLDSHSVEAEAIAKHPESAAISWRAVEQLAQPGVPLETSFKFYGGPADDAHLAFDNSLRSVVIYSWETFDPISRGLVKVLSFLYNIVPNYGICIILLTFIIKTALHPLTRKALVSGHQMQKLQPHLKSIKEKHGSDPRKQQEEMMKVWREHGVSPFGSCLPMLVQIPIFIALYGAFARDFSMRQAPFISSWISDLSQPDQLFSLHFTIPFLEWTHFNLLPILYLVLQLIQMSMTPPSADPQMRQQQQMMKIMPIFFMWFFYPMPSGLVLYFTVSAAYTLVEHLVIKRKLDGPSAGGTVSSISSAPAEAGQGFGKKGKHGKRK